MMFNRDFRKNYWGETVGIENELIGINYIELK